MSYEDDICNVKKHFRERLNLYGDTPAGVQWSSLETQEKRFDILLELADIDKKKILDFGCGTGGFADYLKKRGIQVEEYIGVDLVEDSLHIAKYKHPKGLFLTTREFFNSGSMSDYSFISGVFNMKLENNVEYYHKILEQVWKKTRYGIAFNMMSSYVDYYDHSLFYEEPEKVFSFVKKKLSPYVSLRNDYQVKPGVIPFEFTVYVYRENLRL